MKRFLFVIALLIPAVLFCQSLSPGVSFGTIPPVFGNDCQFAGVNLEYGIPDSDYSVNTGIDFLFTGEKTIVSIPLYMKASAGRKVRFCPLLGGFVNSGLSLGWLVGAGAEVGQKNKINLFLQAELYGGYQKETQTTREGIRESYWSEYLMPQLRIGMKENILRHP